MSALLKGRCVRVIRTRVNVATGIWDGSLGGVGAVEVRETKLPLTKMLEARRYGDLSSVKGMRSSAKSDLHLGICRVSPARSVGVARRYQHSEALEQIPDIDHAHIIASYPEWIKPQDTLPKRHIGPSDEEIVTMLKELNQPDLDAFIRQTIPDSIRARTEFSIPSEQTPETEMLDELTKAGKANSAAEVDTYIGMGYHPTITPGVIKRKVLQNPGWYTSYTPYQPEISQGNQELGVFCLHQVVSRVY